MANHLIIGLGGTGGKIIRELRKRIVEECGSIDPQVGSNVEYIYVDSSPKDLEDNSAWKVLGRSVHLSDSQKVSIHGINQTILNNPAGYPGFHSFVTNEDRELINQHLGTLINTGIGGQRRRLGRLLFANNICDRNNGNNFLIALDDAVNKLRNKPDADNNITFHICAGLAGGTGSGTIVDTIAQIRKHYPYDQNTRENKIRLFLYVPEKSLANPTYNQGFYQANGYAALEELNAISINKYAPRDISGAIDHNTGEVQRLLENDETFQIAYLYTNVNEKNKNKDLNSTLPEAVADFIYQTVIVASAPGVNGAMTRLVDCENSGAQPENDNTGMPSRSIRFMSFGISKAIFPENEIKEYTSYIFAGEATKQLLYNHWVPGQGYDERTADGMESAVKQKADNNAIKEQFRITDDYLKAEKGIVSTDDTDLWRPYNDTWKKRIDSISAKVQGDFTFKVGKWLDSFKQKLDTYVSTGFRGYGLNKFFEYQTDDIEKNAGIIRGLIEDSLFNEWINATRDSMSLIQMDRFVEVIERALSDKKVTISKEITKLGVEELKFKQMLTETETNWDSTLTVKKPFVYSAYVDNSYEYYTSLTQRISLQYEIALINRISIELNQLRNSGIKPLITLLKDFLTESKNQANSRCVDSGTISQSAILKIYDPENVRGIVNSYKSSDTIQQANISATRDAINSLFGTKRPTFQLLVNSIDTDVLLDTVYSVEARNALLETGNRNPNEKMVDVNILEKIQTNYATPQARDSFISDMVNRASAHLPFNKEETALTVVGATPMQRVVQVALPLTNDQGLLNFRTQLIGEFQGKLHLNPNDDVSENSNISQLVVVCANSGFPLRFSANLSTLKSEYDNLVSKRNPKWKLNKMLLHTETFTDRLPSLYELTPEDIKRICIKPLLIAFATNVVQLREDVRTGEQLYSMNDYDEILKDNWISLGANFSECLSNLSNNLSRARTLISLVKVKMQDYVHIDRKRALHEQLSVVLRDDILNKLYSGDQNNKDYQMYRNAVQEIIKED